MVRNQDENGIRKTDHDFLVYSDFYDLRMTMPEEMEQAAAECGLRVLYSAGVDFAFGDDRLEEMPQGTRLYAS